MNRAKIFIASTLLLAFAVCVSAQTPQTIDNLQEFDYLAKGKVKDLKFTVSTSEDVKKIFGESCEKGCIYENDWDIYFRYFDDEWIDKTFAAGRKELIYKPKPEFIGKLGYVVIQPRKQILLSENAVFSDEFECRNNTFIRGNKIRINSRTCVKNKNDIYIFSNETTTDGKISKGQLILVQFIYSGKNSDIMNLVN